MPSMRINARLDRANLLALAVCLALSSCAYRDPDLRGIPTMYDPIRIESEVRPVGCGEVGVCVGSVREVAAMARRGDRQAAIEASTRLINELTCRECRRACLRKRAAVYIEMERYKEALDDLNEALEADADDDVALFHRSRMHYVLGHDDEASEDIKRGRSRKHELFLESIGLIGQGGVI